MSIEHESPERRSLPPGSSDPRLSRREILRYGLCSAGAAFLASRIGRAADAKPPKAKSVIQVWLAGGPSHLDSFDPKPEAGNDYCGPLNNPIATNVDGIRIGELLGAGALAR